MSQAGTSGNTVRGRLWAPFTTRKVNGSIAYLQGDASKYNYRLLQQEK